MNIGFKATNLPSRFVFEIDRDSISSLAVDHSPTFPSEQLSQFRPFSRVLRRLSQNVGHTRRASRKPGLGRDPDQLRHRLAFEQGLEIILETSCAIIQIPTDFFPAQSIFLDQTSFTREIASDSMARRIERICGFPGLLAPQQPVGT